MEQANNQIKCFARMGSANFFTYDNDDAESSKRCVTFVSLIFSFKMYVEI